MIMSPALASVRQLSARVDGQIFTPDDPGYDSARMAWNLNVNQYPAVIVVAKNTADVVEAVRFAAAENLGIAVMATGHGISRLPHGAMLIVTAQMTQVRINAEAQTAWVEAGTKWGKVLEMAQAVGLAPLLGSSPEVGAVGYTLGGGMGWLARKYGISADNVNFFEIVTADGQLLRASQSENSDLFWALRGGGGSYGAVVGMEIKLFPVTMVYAGNLFYPFEAAKAVYTRFREWAVNAPDELTSSISIANVPPIPVFPEFMQGKTIIIVRGAYSGSVEDGEALVKKTWLDWMPPIVNGWHPMPFSEAETISGDPKDPSHGHSTAGWLRDLSDETIDTLIEMMPASTGSPVMVAEIRHAGGAIAKVDPASSAYGNRDASFILQMMGLTPTPDALYHFKAYAEKIKAAVANDLTGGVYINFLEGEEKFERTSDAFREQNYRRLQAIKLEYDPNNRFGYSFNIPAVKHG